MGRIDGFSAQARIALSTAALTASSVVVALMGVLAVHLSARDLGHIGYGEFVTVTSIVGMVTLIADLGITSVTARDVAKERHRAAEIIGEALTFRLTMCAVIAPIVVVGAYFVYPHHGGTVVLGIGVLVFDLFCNAILTVSSAYSLTVYATTSRRSSWSWARLFTWAARWLGCFRTAVSRLPGRLPRW